MTHRYRMFLDDVRELAWVYPDACPDDWIVCRSVQEAATVVSQQGWPVFVSFDHDLGDGVPTGMDLARMLVELDLDAAAGRAGMPVGFAYAVHSANPVGRANIQGLLDGYLRHRQDG